MAVVNDIDQQASQIHACKLRRDLVLGECGQEGIIEIPPQDFGLFGRVSIHDRLRVLRRIRPEQIHYKHR
jgi:hypothetical protein